MGLEVTINDIVYKKVNKAYFPFILKLLYLVFAKNESIIDILYCLESSSIEQQRLNDSVTSNFLKQKLSCAGWNSALYYMKQHLKNLADSF